MKVVAISGFKMSGKDTTADYLVNFHGFIKKSFAASLKDLVAEQYYLDRSSLDDQAQKEQPLLKYPCDPKDEFSEMLARYMELELPIVEGKPYFSPRALCILEGSVKRFVNSRYWVQRVIDDIAYSSNERNYVISDLRYRSEMEQLREFFGDALVTVRMNRWDNSYSKDPSETDLINIPHDWNIYNSAANSTTKEQLFNQIEELVKIYNLGRV